MAIKIIGDGWNVDSTETTQILAEFVYETFSSFVGYELENDILVDNNLQQGYPLAHFNKKGEDWQITLSCESGVHWSQVAYQLAHEICHLYCNHAQCCGHKHKWFEESLCECASIAVLDKISLDWKQSRMMAYSPDYGDSVASYIADVKGRVIKQIENQTQFVEWLSNHIADLEKSSTLRDLNLVVALYIYHVLLESNSSNWVSITTINTWDCFSNGNFNEFQDNWLSASNNNLREVEAITSLLRE